MTRHTREEQQRFVQALKDMDAFWLRFLNKKDFYDLNYSDLFTELWLQSKPVTKMQARQFIQHLGPQTAAKYVDKAVKMGYLVEQANTEDKRSKLVALSPELETGLKDFFDFAIDRFKTALDNDSSN